MFNNAKVCLLCGSKMPCWDKKCKKGNERRGFRHQIRVSGFFRLVTPYVRNKVVPLPYGTDQATTRHSSGCAYRQLRCCKF